MPGYKLYKIVLELPLIYINNAHYKYTLRMYIMNARKLLFTANSAMVITLVLFCAAAYLAWFEGQAFPLRVVAVMHMLQIVLAALFKLSYVLRLIAQNQLGEVLR